MAKTLDEYKKEFKELDERASRLEAEIQKAEAQKEMLLKQLKDDFSIESIESIQPEIDAMKLKLETMMTQFQTNLEKMQEYVSKLEGALNGK